MELLSGIDQLFNKLAVIVDLAESISNYTGLKSKQLRSACKYCIKDFLSKFVYFQAVALRQRSSATDLLSC